jgi:predicted metal-dependent HD superfamily phosphohydrolase
MLGDVSDTSSGAQTAAVLSARWAALAADLGIDDGATALRDDLLARYGEPHRHHHDRRHLYEVLAALDALSDVPPSPAVRLAAWFHDAVYDGTAGDDEAASADLARRSLDDVGADPSLCRRVAGLVEATALHLIPGEGPPVDADTALLLDADLWILAADEARYDAYAAGIRAEHPDVDDDVFRSGRLGALTTLTGRERLFHTERGRAELEPQARSNLAREIAALSASADGG